MGLPLYSLVTFMIGLGFVVFPGKMRRLLFPNRTGWAQNPFDAFGIATFRLTGVGLLAIALLTGYQSWRNLVGLG